MSHGHFMEVCSRCGNVVQQCRCVGPKEIRHVDGCYKCNASASGLAPARQEIKVAEQTPTNTQSDEIAALRKRLSDMENAFHDFVMLHEPVEGFDSTRI